MIVQIASFGQVARQGGLRINAIFRILFPTFIRSLFDYTTLLALVHDRRLVRLVNMQNEAMKLCLRIRMN